MPGPRDSAVVGLPPGSRHELGALAFAVALRRRGVGVLYLGADVTVDGWVDALARTRARAAVIGVVTPDDRAAAAVVVAACSLATCRSSRSAARQPSAPRGSTPGVVRVADRVVEAAAAVADAIGGRRR